MSASDGKLPHITIRAPRELREAIRLYAERHSTSVTRLTLDYYRALLESETKQEADQI